MMGKTSHTSERFAALRLLLALGVVSPMLIPLAIRGAGFIPGYWLEAICGAMILAPNILLYLRMRISRQSEGPHMRTVGQTRDRSRQMAANMAAMLLIALCIPEPGSWRDMVAISLVLILVTLLMWRLGLHFACPYVLLSGYRVIEVQPPDDAGPHTDRAAWTLLTRSSYPRPGDVLGTHRITDTVYLDG